MMERLTERPVAWMAFWGVLLVVAVAVCYGQVSSSADYFALDSGKNITQNYNAQLSGLSLDELRNAAIYADQGLSARWVPYLSFGLNYYFSGQQFHAPAYRYTNMAILALCGLGVMCLAYLLALRWSPRREALLVALVAGLVWTLHPLQTNITTYIVQRMTSLAILGYVWAFVFYILGERRSRWYWVGTALFALLAFSSKQISWFLPLSIAIYRYGWDENWLGRYRKGFPAALVAGLLLAVGVVTWMKMDLYGLHNFDLSQRLMTQGRVLWRYVGQFALPLPALLNLDHQVAISTGWLTPWTTLVAWLLHGVVIAAAVRLWSKARLACVLVLLYYLHHLMESTTLGLELMFEHRMSLPGVFLSVLVGLALVRAAGVLIAEPRRNAIAVTTAALILGVCVAGATIARNSVWLEEEGLYRDIAVKSPNKARTHVGLARLQFIRGDLNGAQASYQKALQIDKRHANAWHGLSLVYSATNRCDEAERIVSAFAGQNRADGKLWNSLGSCYGKVGNADKALPALYKATEYPPIMGTRYDIAVIYLRQNRLEEARQWARQEVEIFPSNQEAATLYYQLGGR